jgi:hypothetical protein
LSSKQESLNVKKYLFKILKNKLISYIILTVTKYSQELFRAMLMALVCRVVKNVGGNDRVKQVLNGLGQARRSG